MPQVIELDRSPGTSQLVAAVTGQFNKGIEAVCLVQGSNILGTLLSRAATQKATARWVTELWTSDEIKREVEEM